MGQIRIIGGQWKRTPITVSDQPGLRPTPDRVRETLFNWLGQRLDGWHCLDLFAGSGALGLEAASRGAAHVVFVESDGAACASIQKLIEKFCATSQCAINRADALAWLALTNGARPCEQFDLVFLDPPFGKGWLERVLPGVIARLKPEGLIYIEAETPLQAAWAQALGLEIIRADKAGMVHYHLLQTNRVEEDTAC